MCNVRPRFYFSHPFNGVLATLNAGMFWRSCHRYFTTGKRFVLFLVNEIPVKVVQKCEESLCFRIRRDLRGKFESHSLSIGKRKSAN